MRKLKEACRLFLIMVKIGLFTFGGGYAMLALLENEYVTRRGWMTSDDFLDMVAIAESTPGPIAINSATYIGYRRAGVLGSAFSTIGVCVPSFVIIYVISLFFDAFLQITAVAAAFRGIQAGVVYLILSAGIKMLKKLPRDAAHMALFAVALLAMLAFSLFALKFSTIVCILLGGALGLAFFGISLLREKKRTADKEGEA